MYYSFPAAPTRAVAKATLFLWLLGFVAGVANACLLETRHDHQGQVGISAAAPTDAADDCDPAVGEQACKSLRDLEQGALAKAKVLDGADDLPAFGFVASRSVAASAPSPLAWQAWAAPPLGPPVAILFLRLIL